MEIIEYYFEASRLKIMRNMLWINMICKFYVYWEFFA